MKIKKRENKKAVFFSTDALIALLIIFLTILVVYPSVKYAKHESRIQSDVIKVLSSLKIGEVEDAYVQQLITDGDVDDLNKSVLQQIGDLYVINTQKAELLALAMLNYLDTKENVGIWINNELLASTAVYDENTARNIETDRQIISGLKEPDEAGEVTGYFATAFLSHASQKKYFYFGGYTGDGNISIEVPYNEIPEHVDLEVTANTNFNIWINREKIEGEFQGADSQFTPIQFDLDAYTSYFNQEINEVKFTPVNSEEKLYFAGGYLRVTYKNTEIYNDVHEYNFPAVQGVINIYDSFYVPGELNGMSIKLDYQSSYELFLNIGGKTVFSGSSETRTTKEITSAELIAAGIDFAALSRNTTPIRLGLYELGEAIGGNADVILITDLSGSMDWRLNSESVGVERDCDDPNLYSSTTKRVSLAKCLDKIVVDKILESPGNRIALSAFYGDAGPPNKGRVYYEDLTNDADYLKSRISLYSPQGGTAICASINNAYNILNEQSEPDRLKFIIVMSDGIPTHTCGSMAGGGTTCDGLRDGTPANEALWLGNGQPEGARCYGGFDDCEVTDCQCASDNAEWSSCRAYDDLGATVYSIGFGPVASCTMASNTLEDIAECGKGEYFASDDPEMLKEIYEQIAEEIIALSYIDQMTNVVGDFENTELFSGSSISFGYTPDAVPYGLILTFQTEEFGNTASQGSFYVPEDSTIIEANAISYSGPRWTDYVYIKDIGWKPVFSLSDYGNKYIELGDAYVVNLPLIFLSAENNNIKITTGVTPGDSDEASASDKVIYTISTNTPTSSGISGFSEGCTWTLEFYDGSSEIITIPSDYSDGNTCSYASPALGGIDYNKNDAQQAAVFNLLEKLDINGDGRLDAIFTAEDMEIDTSEIIGIPWEWSAEIQVRRWD